MSGPAAGGTLSPAQVSQAYQFNRITFGGVPGDGSGQTIAIVDAYNDPNIAGDLQAFDAQFGLPNPPSFRVVAQDGSNNLPGMDPSGPGTNNWEGEEALDVEWAHAMAPGANILLVETNDPDNLYNGVNFARKLPGVSVVSMSFGGPEDVFVTPFYDQILVTPGGHPGVTFVASSGDSAVVEYPSCSPNVLAVGGTNLSVDAGNNWAGENAWNLSGGGESQFEPLPSWQQFLQFGPSPDRRFTPDVAYDAGTGVWVYDSYNGGPGSPWFSTTGTSAGAPQWSALVAIADQGRALAGLAPLDGPSQTLPLIYQLTEGLDYHDITSGTTVNGLSAHPGWDEVTGWGTPVANRVAAHLVFGPVDQPPVAHDDTYTVQADAPFGLVVNAANGVLANDTDLENDPLTAQWLNAPAHGRLSFEDDGSFIYVPDRGFFGQDSFTYFAMDVDGISNVATVIVNVSQQLNLQGGVLTVNGDQLGLAYNDVITLDTNAQGGVLVNLNGQLFSYAPGAVSAVNVYGGGGNDTVNVESIPAGVAVTVNRGSGSDVVNVCPTGHNLDTLQGGLTVHGNGTATLSINDQANPNNVLTQDYLTATGLTRDGLTYDQFLGTYWSHDASIGFDGLAQVTLTTGGGFANLVYVESTFAAATVNAGAGNALVAVSAQAENLDNLQGPVTVHGNGSDALAVYDQNNPNTVLTEDTLTRNSLARDGLSVDPILGILVPHDAWIAFDGLAQVTLNAGGISDIVYVESTLAATTVNAGPGNALVEVSSQAENLDNLQGPLTVHGNGSDALVVNDQNNPNNVLTQDFLTATGLARDGLTVDPVTGNLVPHDASIGLDGLSQVTLNAGGTACLVQVVSTAAGTPVTINSLISDVVLVGNSTDGVADIQGAVNIAANGAAGVYTALMVDDSAYHSGYWISALSPSGLTTAQRTDSGSPVSVAPISFVQSDLSALTIRLATNPVGHGNAVYVTNTPTSGYSGGLMTTISTGIGAGGAADEIYVAATTGPLTANLLTDWQHVGSGIILGGNARTLDNIRGPVTVNTLNGWTALALDDSGSTAGHTYTVTKNTIAFRPNLPVLTYHVNNDVWFVAGSGVNTINVDSTSAATIVNAGLSGSDTINVGGPGKTLQSINGGYLDFQISKPGSHLYFNDQGDAYTQPQTYTIGMLQPGVAELLGGNPNAPGGNEFFFTGPLGALTLSASSGNDKFAVQSLWPSPTKLTIKGGPGSNTLLGPNSGNTWLVSGTNSGSLDQTISFGGVQNLVGGTGTDVFKVGAGKGLTGSINGGGGGDWLDYSAWTTPVTVNLVTGAATGIAGGVSNIANVRGGSGNDTLTGGGGNILIGGAGSNTLVDAYAGSATAGRSLLIGGTGNSILTAGAAGDMLIAGTTSYDANYAALQSLLAEWQSADNYTTRFQRLEGLQSGGLNGKYKLVWGSTVKDTDGLSVLTGGGAGAGLDWFFANYPGGNDTIKNFDAPGDEYLNNAL
jgi:hypothetical protein